MVRFELEVGDQPEGVKIFLDIGKEPGIFSDQLYAWLVRINQTGDANENSKFKLLAMSLGKDSWQLVDGTEFESDPYKT